MKKTEGYPQPFGASRRGRSVNLAVCVPKDVSCELLLYKKGESEPDQVIEMPAEEESEKSASWRWKIWRKPSMSIITELTERSVWILT